MTVSLINNLIFGAAALLPMGIFWLGARRERERLEQEMKPPQREKLLRPAGYSLSQLINEKADKLLDALLFACGCSVMVALLVALAAVYAGARAIPAAAMAGAAALISGGAGVFYSFRANRLRKELRNYRLGLRGEQAVAEALHQLNAGYWVFHDLVLEKEKGWNMDHIVVGTRGVYLIETKARSKRKGEAENYKVIYDGKALQFPTGWDDKAVAQAARNARQLTELLSKVTAEHVVVQPVVVLPGWWAESKGNYPVKVMSANYLIDYLRGERPKISEVQVERIRVALDDKCRDVEF